MVFLASTASGIAQAADSPSQPRRATICGKVDQQNQRVTLTPQQRQRLRDCKAQRPVPWVVDPTPIFIL